MSDIIIASLITATAPCVLILVQSYLQWYRDRIAAEKIDSIKDTGEANHVLQNSSYSAQLKLTSLAKRANAVLMRRIAVLTGEQGDMDAAGAAEIDADESEKLFLEHEEKQAKVDAMKVGTYAIT